MVNWIIGGIIIGLTVFIIVKRINSIRKGESSCCSGGCSLGKGECNCDHKL
ncbi:MAG: hypothetical protein K0R69_2753 [Clostridia bacterium]|jgi:large-conductance mechanosensitive channel|nr:hypothetical protein [Clostridia bacterium]